MGDTSHRRTMFHTLAAAAAAAVCVLLMGCGADSNTHTAASGQFHPVTNNAAAAIADPDNAATIVEGLLEGLSGVGVFFGLLGLLIAAAYLTDLRMPDAKIRRRIDVQGPVRGCVADYVSTVGHEFQFEIKEMSPARWRIYMLAHPYDDDESSRVRYRWLRLLPSREQDRVCWSRRLRDPLDAYRVAVLWAESASNYATFGRFAPPDERYAPNPPPGSEMEALTAPYRNPRRQGHDTEFSHMTAAGSVFKFGLRCDDAGWLIHILDQPDYGTRSTDLRDTHRLRNTRGESLVCWTEQLASPLDAYRVAVVWAEATCNYITAGCFEAFCVPEDVPAPAAGSALARQCLTE